MPRNHQMFRSSMVVGLFGLLGGLTGILVETSIAAQLGLSRGSDTFYVAYTLPYIITNLLSATGQFSLVPFFARLDAGHNRDELWKGFSYCVNMLFLVLGGLALLGGIGSSWMIRGIAPGLTHHQVELATDLSRWLFLIIIPAGIVEVFRSLLFSQHRFALPAATGFERNVTVVAVIFLGFHHYGSYSIVLGYMAGYLLQLLVLGVAILLRFRPRYTLTLEAGGEAFRNLRGAGTAQLGAAAGWQVVVIVERIIASFLPAGTLTALNYCFKILSALVELLGGSVGTAALPTLSRSAAANEQDETKKTFGHALEISLTLLSPAVVFCLLLDHHIIRLVFQRGNFTPEATASMGVIFFYYCLSLFPFAFLRLLAFALFARHEPGPFVRISTLQFILMVGFDLLYVGVLRWGAKGIPLGLLTALILTSALAIQRNLADVRRTMDRTFRAFAARTVMAGLLAAVVVGTLRHWVHPPVSTSQTFIYLCELCGAGVVVYACALAALRGRASVSRQ